MSIERVVIVGAGSVATGLAHAFSAVGVSVVAIAARRPDRAAALASQVPGARAVPLADACSAGTLVLVAVSDSAIEAAAEALKPVPEGLVAHTSGSRPAAALGAVANRGAVIGGFHPLAAVVSADQLVRGTADAATIFRGAAFAVEAQGSALDRLSALARSIGGVPFQIRAGDKPLYHLGASMLAAFSGGLAQIAWDRMRAAGASAEVASAGVGHLLETVARNVARSASPAVALTGPVARGDAGGVRRQAETAQALSHEAQDVYRVHVAHNIRLAMDAGRIDSATADALRAAIRNDA